MNVFPISTASTCSHVLSALHSAETMLTGFLPLHFRFLSPCGFCQHLCCHRFIPIEQILLDG